MHEVMMRVEPEYDELKFRNACEKADCEGLIDALKKKCCSYELMQKTLNFKMSENFSKSKSIRSENCSRQKTLMNMKTMKRK